MSVTPALSTILGSLLEAIHQCRRHHDARFVLDLIHKSRTLDGDDGKLFNLIREMTARIAEAQQDDPEFIERFDIALRLATDY